MWATTNTVANTLPCQDVCAHGQRRHFRSTCGRFVSDNENHSGEFTREEGGTTHFGFRDVPVDEKEDLVRGVFNSVADNYDVMNDLMSGTLHRYWKDEMVASLHPMPGMHILDVAGGTGDISFRIHESMRRQSRRQMLSGSNGDVTAGSITVCDINTEMLRVGQGRAEERGFDLSTMKFVEGNAMDLHQFEDNRFDAYTIAFGIRNVTDVSMALREAHRVLRRGGRFMCLEFSRVENDMLRQIYDTYSFNVIPKVGQLVANDRDSYEYLVESIRKFPDQHTFEGMIREAGFSYASHRNFTNGVVAIHTGFKL